MALLRPLLAAAASVAIAAATATGQRAPGLACKHGALAAGGDIKRENMTVASASAWCESQPACAGFTANTNGTAGICGGGGGSEQLFDMRFKDSEQGNGDPLWTTWTRPGHTSVYFFCSSEHTCSLCDPPNGSCAKVTYLDETVVFYGGPKAKQEKYASFLAEATGSGAVTKVYRDNISHWSMLRRGGGEGARENAAAAEQGQEQQGQEQQGQQELRGSGVGAGGAGSGGGGSVREALRAAGIETRREESMRNRLRNNQLRLKDPSLH